MIMLGKVIVSGRIKAKTGLHIGTAGTGLEIGGVDKVVVRNPITNQPYIPGSSLKGKIRALLERGNGLASEDERVWVKKGEVSMHLCDKPDCFLCNIFGRNNGQMTKVSGEKFKIVNSTPTRLIVHDGNLIVDSLKGAETDLQYTEVKIEIGVDRITSQANIRQIERVPAGAEFDFSMIYTVYSQGDIDNLRYLFEGMKLLEDDYLGGSGSRGSGQVEFDNLNIEWRSNLFYKTGIQEAEHQRINGCFTTIEQVLANFEQQIKYKIKLQGE